MIGTSKFQHFFNLGIFNEIFSVLNKLSNLTFLIKQSDVNNGQTSNMTDHFQALVRQIKIKIAEMS